MTITLVSHVFCSISHMSAAFLKEFQLLHAARLINVSSKAVDQSEDDGGGASFYLQQQIGMATVFFLWQHGRESILFCAFF